MRREKGGKERRGERREEETWVLSSTAFMLPPVTQIQQSPLASTCLFMCYGGIDFRFQVRPG